MIPKELINKYLNKWLHYYDTIDGHQLTPQANTYIKITDIWNKDKYTKDPILFGTFIDTDITYDLFGIYIRIRSDIQIAKPSINMWVTNYEFKIATLISNEDEILLLDLRFMHILLNAEAKSVNI